MKRCPKCNRTYPTDTQKFCTHDGGLLFGIDAGLSDTVQFDSAKIQDAVAKPTTRDLENKKPPEFDPEATVVSPPIDLNEATREVRARNTGELVAPQATQHQMPQPPAPPVSGPIPPPQPAAPTPSGPIAPSAPQQAETVVAQSSQPLPQAQPSQPLPAARKKKSKLPLVLGVLAVLLLLGVGGLAAAYFFVLQPMIDEKRTAQNTNSEPIRTTPTPAIATSPSEVTPPSTEARAYVPPPDAVQFVNAKENVSKKLAAHYVDFSFYYPERWEKDAKSGVGDSENFVEVHRQLPPNFTQESMAISWYDSAGSVEGDQSSFHSFVENKSSQFGKNIEQYRKVSEGPTKIGIYDGYEFRFEGISQETEKGQFKIWGRVVWLPASDGSKTGATLLMLTTSLAPELKSAEDIGEKGELSMLLESFRFGKK